MKHGSAANFQDINETFSEYINFSVNKFSNCFVQHVGNSFIVSMKRKAWFPQMKAILKVGINYARISKISWRPSRNDATRNVQCVNAKHCPFLTNEPRNVHLRNVMYTKCDCESNFILFPDKFTRTTQDQFPVV